MALLNFKCHIKKRKEMLQIIPILLLLACLIPATAMSIPPPKVIAEKNLRAPVILIGEVVSIDENSDLPYFSVKAEHIIKGHDHVKKGDQVNILFNLALHGATGLTSSESRSTGQEEKNQPGSNSGPPILPAIRILPLA